MSLPIDLTDLPPPDVVETVSVDSLLAARKAAVIGQFPAEQQEPVRRTLELESEPATKLLRENSYRELIIRTRINEAAQANYLAFAQDADLDAVAANYNVRRLLVTPADLDAMPPIDAVWESNDRLRYRMLLKLESLSVAGPRAAYEYHALTASADVDAVQVERLAPGTVGVFVLDRRGLGVPDAALLATVNAALSAEDVRPLCDTVQVLAATPKLFAISAIIEFETGGEQISGGLDAATLRLAKMITARRRLGDRGLIARSAIDSALHVSGVRRVTIPSPAADVVCGMGEFPQCIAIDLQKP